MDAVDRGSSKINVPGGISMPDLMSSEQGSASGEMNVSWSMTALLTSS